ncbi:hypothetical protein ACIBJE_15710 [Micromonospora sp. NPDC050187]|uniref:hypothetical protein n=1 Tax=Micromonospora sp. NPDC050187 TaxID=3364277 RepID=UPI003787618C
MRVDRVTGAPGSGWSPAGGPPGPAGVVGAVAAFAVGVLAGTALPALTMLTGYTDLTPFAPVRAGVLAPVVLALAVVAAALPYRVGGWPVALAGLLLAVATDLLTPGGLLPTNAVAARQASAFLVGAVGVGLALGGVLLVAGGSARAVRVPVAVGLAAGLVGQPACSALLRAGLPVPGRVQPYQISLWLAVALVAAALLVSWRRVGPGPAGGPLRWTPVLVVTAVGLLVAAGFAVRWSVVRARLRPGQGLEEAALTAARLLVVPLTVVAGLLLLGYALRALGVVGARWVVLAVAAGPIAVTGGGLTGVVAPAVAFLAVLTGLAAVAGGVALTRYAERIMPWDALGIVLAAMALPLAAPAVRLDLPTAAGAGVVLTALGLGLALGSGLTLVATREPGLAWQPGAAATVPPSGVVPPSGTVPPAGTVSLAEADRGWRSATLLVGVAAWALAAQAATPLAIRAQVPPPGLVPPLTLPLLIVAAAVLLALLFGLGLLVDRRPAPEPVAVRRTI